jgi:Holliday junction resolvasome RuvABC endonuclease subunit
LVDSFVVSAPRDEDEAAQLHELAARTHDLIEHRQPDLFALRAAEIRAGRALSVARRAEGAVLAAVGETRDLPVSIWVRQSLGGAAGLGATATADNAVSTLLAAVDPAPAGAEIQQAAAAAVAALRRAV